MKNILIILIASAPFLSHAFTLNNSVAAAFPNNEVSINVASNLDCSNVGLSAQEILNMAESAVSEYWNRAPTSRLKLRKGNLTNVSASFGTDSVCNTNNPCDPNLALKVSTGILIACNSNAVNFTSTGVLGLSVPNNISGVDINGSIILLNNLAGSAFGNLSDQEKKSVIAHEIGHAIGLGHSPVTDSLMHAESAPSRAYLGLDDIHGVGYLYGREQPIGGCGTIEFTNNTAGRGLLFLTGLILLSLLTLGLMRPQRS